jgi:GNAT superfamily N-acetyltransferase
MGMNNIRIGKANESDLPIIEKLMIELIRSMDNKEGIDTHMVLENCRNLLSEANSYLLVAEMDRTVRGFINFTTRKTLLHPGPSGLIDELVITRNYRVKGVGKKLIYATIEKCKQLGCCEVEVSTEFTNTNAKEFYKKCGFEERGLILEKDLL